MIEKIWNREHIESVAITLNEEIGIDGRGTFWEETGLVRDVVQNHIMQLVALIGMEKPKSDSEVQTE
jgi:glucose-6-phosphate 1-dehydrogenase